MPKIVKGEAFAETLHTINFGNNPARQLDQVPGNLAVRSCGHTPLAGNATRLTELFHDAPPSLYKRVLLLSTPFFICRRSATCQGRALSPPSSAPPPSDRKST